MMTPNMMPPNGLPPQNGNGMQRPQHGNASQQIHARVLMELHSTIPQVGSGWQSTYDVKQRSAKIMQL